MKAAFRSQSHARRFLVPTSFSDIAGGGKKANPLQPFSFLKAEGGMQPSEQSHASSTRKRAGADGAFLLK